MGPFGSKQQEIVKGPTEDVVERPQTGFGRHDIEYVLQHDRNVLSFERIDEMTATACWRVSYSCDGRQPVEMLIDNGLNERYVQALVKIEDHADDALLAVGQYDAVGLAAFDGAIWMRSGLFIDHSRPEALVHSYHSVASALHAFLRSISAPHS